MKHANSSCLGAAGSVLWLFSMFANAAQPPVPTPSPPVAARDAAPFDLTGMWVSVISEDWRWRMVTPLKGDFASIPLNAEARKVGALWDPAKDEAAGEQCKGYSAPAIMREPGRLRISWQDDNTLKIETDSGMQTRLLHFGGTPPADAPRDWQGYSAAAWEAPPALPGTGFFGLGVAPRVGVKSTSLQVTTTQVRPGYLRKNGIPFSAELKMAEYFDTFEEQDGTQWFVITSVVEDPVYLNAPWVTTLNFKKEQDPSKWRPAACSAR